jgi:hypothetical protein
MLKGFMDDFFSIWLTSNPCNGQLIDGMLLD